MGADVSEPDEDEVGDDLEYSCDDEALKHGAAFDEEPADESADEDGDDADDFCDGGDVDF